MSKKKVERPGKSPITIYEREKNPETGKVDYIKRSEFYTIPDDQLDSRQRAIENKRLKPLVCTQVELETLADCKTVIPPKPMPNVKIIRNRKKIKHHNRKFTEFELRLMLKLRYGDTMPPFNDYNMKVGAIAKVLKR